MQYIEDLIEKKIPSHRFVAEILYSAIEIRCFADKRRDISGCRYIKIWPTIQWIINYAAFVLQQTFKIEIVIDDIDMHMGILTIATVMVIRVKVLGWRSMRPIMGAQAIIVVIPVRWRWWCCVIQHLQWWLTGWQRESCESRTNKSYENIAIGGCATFSEFMYARMGAWWCWSRCYGSISGCCIHGNSIKRHPNLQPLTRREPSIETLSTFS